MKDITANKSLTKKVSLPSYLASHWAKNTNALNPHQKVIQQCLEDHDKTLSTLLQ